MNQTAIPSRWRYLYPVTLLIVGLAITALLAFAYTKNFVESLTRAEIPGTTEFHLESGAYTIYLEYQSVVDSTLYSANPNSYVGLNIGLYNKSTSQSVDLKTPKVTDNYGFQNKSGTSIFTFSITIPGTYELTAQYPNNTGPKGILAVGPSSAKTILSIITILSFMFGTMAASGIWFSRIRKKRKKFRTTH